MTNRNQEQAFIFKALSDPHRLAILEMLSCGELCACKLLEKFEITQPTLSHHMKILSEAGLVVARREGKWMHYALNIAVIKSLQNYITEITSDKAQCICKDGGCCQ